MRFTKTLILITLIAKFHISGEAHVEKPDSTDRKQLDIPLVVYSKSKVIKVTNLNRKGSGSLREAIEADVPRVIVFEVGGVIDLEMKTLKIANPFVIIAGQTAPFPGITLIKGGIKITTHDVFIQHLRVRPGDAGQSKKSGWEPDGISTSGESCYNITVDHCSITWAVDENLSASGPRTAGPENTSRKITFSNCIIGEALDDTSHSEGKHSKGTLIHDFCTDILIVGNLYAHNVSRNPYFKAGTTGAIINNIIYNPVSYAIKMNYLESQWQQTSLKPVNGKVSVVGNVLFHGPDTPKKLTMVAKKGDAYMEDNLAFFMDQSPCQLISGQINLLDEKPFWPDHIIPLKAVEVKDYIIKNVGARPAERDVIDKRIVRSFLTSSGKIIDSQEEVGGYPDMKPTSRKLEVPADNLEKWLNDMAFALQQ